MKEKIKQIEINKSMKTRTLIISLFLVIGLSSCDKTLFCSGFPEAMLSYIPYKEGDIINFTNGSDTMSFIVEKLEISVDSSYHYKCPYFCDCDVACDAFARAQLVGVLGNTNSIKYQINTTHAFLGACVEFSQGDNFCIDSFNYYQDNVDSIPPVLTIKPEQTTYISKIQIVKDQGITMFEETASGEMWNILYK